MKGERNKKRKKQLFPAVNSWGGGAHSKWKQGTAGGGKSRRGNNNHHVPAVTWDYTVNIWERVQDGPLENVDCKGVLIPGADGQGVKGLHHINLHSVISNGAPDCLQHLGEKHRDTMSTRNERAALRDTSRCSAFQKTSVWELSVVAANTD